MAMTMTSATRNPLRVAFRAPTSARSLNKNAVRRSFVVYAKDPEQAAKDAAKNVKQGVEGALNTGEDKLRNLSDKAGDIAGDAQREGKKQAGKAESAARDASGDARGAAKDAANKAEKEGKGLGDAIKGGISDAADAVKGKAKDLKDSVNN